MKKIIANILSILFFIGLAIWTGVMAYPKDSVLWLLSGIMAGIAVFIFVMAIKGKANT